MIGEHIKKLRKTIGLTQKELAWKIGISTRSLQRIESGGNSPNIETLAKLCDVFKITLDDFLMEANFGTETLAEERERLGMNSLEFAEKAGILHERYLQIEGCISDPTDVEKLKIAHVFEREEALSITRMVVKDLATMVNENTPSNPESKELFEKFNQLTDIGKAKALEFIDLLLKIPEYKKAP